MGGAVVAEAASRKMISNVVGVAVLDIVEGTVEVHRMGGGLS